MNTIPSNKHFLNHVINFCKLDGKVQNYQVRYKFIKNTEKLKYLLVKVKFDGYSVKMKMYNENI
ncbi:MAG: hypothetical protein ACRCX2_36520 [Paraclostridium sp.]